MAAAPVCRTNVTGSPHRCPGIGPLGYEKQGILYSRRHPTDARKVCGLVNASSSTKRIRAPVVDLRHGKSAAGTQWKAFLNPNRVVGYVFEEADLMGLTARRLTESGANMLATVQVLCSTIFVFRWKADRVIWRRWCGRQSTGLPVRRHATPSGMPKRSGLKWKSTMTTGGFDCGSGTTAWAWTPRFWLKAGARDTTACLARVFYGHDLVHALLHLGFPASGICLIISVSGKEFYDHGRRRRKEEQHMTNATHIRILGVDDDPGLKEGIAAIKSQPDMELVCQASGNDAISINSQGM